MNTLCWKFNVADVSQPNLGADFLCHHGFLVDVRRRRLINAETFETTEAFAVSDKVPSVSVLKPSSAAVFRTTHRRTSGPHMSDVFKRNTKTRR